MIETYCMLGREREAELLREAERLHRLGPTRGLRTAMGTASTIARRARAVLRAAHRPPRATVAP